MFLSQTKMELLREKLKFQIFAAKWSQSWKPLEYLYNFLQPQQSIVSFGNPVLECGNIWKNIAMAIFKLTNQTHFIVETLPEGLEEKAKKIFHALIDFLH